MSDAAFKAPSIETLAELLPQYGIESFIAQGGMGAVYKARQLSLDREVAIKVLPKELGGDADFRESFITEAKAMAKLNHSNLLGVFDYGDVDGMPYIVIEYVEGGSLHQAAWNQVIEPVTAVAIVKGICDGLAHAHDNGIVHRDIKPSNILLTTKAEPKVADFGLAQATDSAESGVMMGTPGYTAPEVFHDYSQAGKLADIYSVGVILHQLLTGIDPAGSMEPPSKATGNLRLDAIWRKATHITPTQRHKSVKELATDLEKWATAMKGQKKPALSPAAMPHQAVKRPLQPANDSGGGAIVKILVFGILIAAGLFAYKLMQNKEEQPKEGVADTHGKASPDPEETTIVKAEPDPIPEPPEEVEPDPIPDPEPEIVETDTEEEEEMEEPEIPPVVDTEPEPELEEDLPPGDPELLERAIGLILDARKKRDKEFAENAGSLASTLEADARIADDDEAASILRLKKDIVDDRIPITEDVSGLPDGLASSFADARTKENVIIEDHLTSLTRIRNAYVTRLKDAAAAAADEELKGRLLAQAGNAEDLDAWVAELSPETATVPKQSTGAFGAGDFPGKWQHLSDRGPDNEIWIAHSDGTLEVEGRPWKGTWKMQDDGTLEVTWQDKPRPYVYKRDGDGWNGTTSFGAPTKLTPHDS